MSKSFKVILSIVMLAVLLLSSASSAFAARERSITLIGAEFEQGKGVVFTFKVNGEFDSYGGTAIIAGQEFTLSCNFKDNGDLGCTMNKGGGKYAGLPALITLNGYSFSVTIRNPNYCYNVYDIVYDEEYEGYFFMEDGSHCIANPGTWDNAFYRDNQLYNFTWIWWDSYDDDYEEAFLHFPL
jgi:hypothetical protein